MVAGYHHLVGQVSKKSPRGTRPNPIPFRNKQRARVGPRHWAHVLSSQHAHKHASGGYKPDMARCVGVCVCSDCASCTASDNRSDNISDNDNNNSYILVQQSSVVVSSELGVPLAKIGLNPARWGPPFPALQAVCVSVCVLVCVNVCVCVCVGQARTTSNDITRRDKRSRATPTPAGTLAKQE